jgi:signal transduction histidine kinase
MRGLKDKVAIVAGAARGNIRAATKSLALHVPLPVELSIVLEDRPPPVEVAVYYLICEALTNVAKYARADAGAVRGFRRDADLAVQVADEGVGGADLANGSGLRGLADRIGALGGLLRVWRSGDGHQSAGRDPAATRTIHWLLRRGTT